MEGKILIETGKYKIILEGIVGSMAYGLNTAESDIDIKGIMVYPTEQILSLQKGTQTINHTDPDIEYHEVEKYMYLASKNNPTILEMLYLDEYERLTNEAMMLLNIREAFLSKNIFKSYGGYALQQAKKLYRKAQSGKPDTRHEKHARHCFRLLFQGKELLETGKLTVKLEKPEIFFEISKMPIDKMIKLFESKFKEFDSINTKLPDKPDYKRINQTLIQIRKMNFERI